VIDTKSPTEAFYKLPQPVLALQGRARTYLSTCLTSMFDQVDDTFFDLADRADNNRQQTMYFDAMRQIRMERKNIEHHFFRCLTQGFQLLGNPRSSGFVEPKDKGLEVIENEQLEEIIALDTMVSKLVEQSKSELEALNIRIDSLVPAKVTMKNNPVGPDVICEAFNESVAHLDLKISIKLVFFKLFDRLVLAALQDFLVDSNRRLKDMGIIPDLEKLKKAKSQPPKKPEPKPAESQQKHVPEPRQFDHSSHESRQRPAAKPSAVHSGGSSYGQFISQLKNRLQWESRSPMASEAAEEGETSRHERVDLEQLNSLVSNLQQDWAQMPQDPESSSRLLDMVEKHLAQQGRNLGGTERGMIDLLDQLFARVNTQAIASSEIAEELRKLELPVLQIALRDNTFFDREKHPARRLLNEIAEASIGYVDDQSTADDPVAKAIASVVDELCNESRQDNVALTQLLLNFIDLVDKERRRVAVLEQRLMEEVAAAEKVNQAHQAVLKVLIRKIQGQTFPRFVVSFAEDAWCKVMFLNHLRCGVDSTEWQHSEQLLDSLLELVRLGDRHEAAVKPVLEAIRSSLESISYDAYDLGRLMGAMEQYFFGEEIPEKGPQHDELTRGISANPLDDVYIQVLRTDIPGNPDMSDDEDDEDIEEQYLRRADSLTRGVWVEFAEESPSRRRCKVAGIIMPEGKFVFVNRQGAKVGQKNRKRVARELKDDKLRALDKSQLFDRALEGVVSDMCQQHSLH